MLHMIKAQTVYIKKVRTLWKTDPFGIHENTAIRNVVSQMKLNIAVPHISFQTEFPQTEILHTTIQNWSCY